jgi:SAM-dependent methyltransferase
MEHDPQRRILLLSGAAGVILLPAPPLPAANGAQAQDLDVPYVPTPQRVVDSMLDLGKVGRNDVLVDLGCGDGRIVIGAARRGARAIGIDLDPARIAEARANAKEAGVAPLATFKVGDLFSADLAPATVVTLYLLPTVNLKLRPRLRQELRAGARVVSHAFDMGPSWPAEQSAMVEGKTVYRWTIGAKKMPMVDPSA